MASYILVDYENVQVVPFHESKEINLIIFLGAQQARIPVALAQKVQVLGERVSYIRLRKPGRDSLDICIGLYLGKLIAKDPGGDFCIVSKDKGFDAAVEHMTEQGVQIKRLAPEGGE